MLRLCGTKATRGRPLLFRWLAPACSRSSSSSPPADRSATAAAASTSGATRASAGEHWTTDRVRSSFVDFFAERHGHSRWPSSPLLPRSADDSLLFVNSGMVQFKPIFEGAVPERGHTFSGLSRAANSQKCIRAGGKHNDLDDVGRDNYHHTFFEMLGSWSFNGDYFKREAIEQAWELLTHVYGLPPNQLYATYFAGCDKLGLPPDHEARDFWLERLPATNVLPGSAEDNFWEMGETGPCGPCSELHFDRLGGSVDGEQGGNGRDASHLVNQDDPNVVEIWNLVFMQFSRSEPGAELVPLSQRHVDTGMGLERLSSILQNKPSNYQIDVFKRIMDAIYALRIKEAASASCAVGVGNIERYGDGVGADEDPDGVDEAYRVVADHARTLVFAIADKVMPGSAGRGYVLRRILRRGVLYGEQKLGLGTNFFSQLVPHVVDTFRDAYPELDAADRISAIVRDEEELFAETWAAGQADFEVIAGEMMALGNTVVTGKDAARLHQERGFPIDLTRLLAEQHGLTVDEAAFAEEQRKHVEASRQRFGKSGNVAESHLSDFVGLENCASELVRQHGNSAYQTDDGMKLEDLTRTMIPAKVLAFCELTVNDGGSSCEDSADGNERKHHVVSGLGMGRGGPGTPVALALDETPYYSEAGGQVADRGLIRWRSSGRDRQKVPADDVIVRVVDVQARGGILWHMGYLESGHCSAVPGGGEDVFCHLDMENRRLVSANHTATHLLNFALREVVSCGGFKSGGGVACDQRGSNVTAEKLRFDFAMDRRVESEELQRVEDHVNARIEQRLAVYTDRVPLDKAMNGIRGLRAVFGESYPDPVRAVSIGRPVDELFVSAEGGPYEKDNGADVSVELCGGTHVQNTGQLKKFALVEERGIAKGVRRVTCLTGQAAQQAMETGELLTAHVNRLEREERPLADLRAAAEKLDSAKTVIPAYAKTKLRERVEYLIKSAAKRASASTKQGAAQVHSKGLDIAEHARAEGLSTVVEYIDLDIDPKTARKVLGRMTSVAPDCAFFLAAKFKGNIACYATGIGEESGSAIDASAWVKSVIAACPGERGKGGGRKDFAQGNGIAVDDLNVLMEEAKTFAL